MTKKKTFGGKTSFRNMIENCQFSDYLQASYLDFFFFFLYTYNLLKQ